MTSPRPAMSRRSGQSEELSRKLFVQCAYRQSLFSGMTFQCWLKTKPLAMLIHREEPEAGDSKYGAGIPSRSWSIEQGTGMSKE